MGRHLWGWGSESRAIALDDVRPRVEPFFGPLLERTARLPRLGAPRVEIPSALRAFTVATDDARLRHAMGKAFPDRVRGFRGDFSSAPDMVAAIRTEDDIVTVLEVAERVGLSVTPFGGGSSVVGGVEPILQPPHRGTLSLDVGALSAVLEVDRTSLVARIAAGTFGPELERQLGQHEVTFRCFPQSFEFSTLGGWIATRAGGHFATGPTHIDDFVEAVRMVTPKGVFETRRFPSSGAGIDANRFVCGSEGSLGVITEAWMRVRRRPRFRATASVAFQSFDAGVEAVRELSQSGRPLSNCRLLDMMEALINGVARDGSSMLLIGFESASHSQRGPIDEAVRVARRHGGRCELGPQVREGDEAPRAEGSTERWRRSFLDGPYLQDALIRLGLMVDTFETACLWSRFPSLYRQVTEAMNEALVQECGGGIISCRFTHVYPDGPAPYFTFIGQSREGEELEQWAKLKNAASEAVVSSGGTITHHHAVGRTHRPWYEREVVPTVHMALRHLKQNLDPRQIMNPGVLL